ncbi:hypothetical protein C8J56DRAFT_1022458 [Mycena floridula]|nr:hypothetical protein C8J56DRAFT_1022458 [Mycena floridula]
MAASQIHNTVKNSRFKNINGGVFSNNTVNVNYIALPATTGGRARGYMPAANEKLYGRDADIEEIVRILTEAGSLDSKRARFALLGAGGQGKTALALKIMAHLAVKQCYPGKNSVWVPCEGASSAALLLDVLYASLDIKRDTHNTIQDILTELNESSDPIILLLDNFETPWNAPGARGAVERILRDIDQLPHVALFVTMRAMVAPCEEIDWEERRIQALDPEASCQLYTAVDKKAKSDSKLPELLDILGHMALAVKLMARHGKNTRYTVDQLISRYRVTGTSMLGRSEGSDSQNSVAISICMSLESSLVKDEVNARLLLDIIASLPSGTTLETLEQWWAPNLENFDGALSVLLQASLLECPTTRYFVLPVIRSYLLEPSRLSFDVPQLMIQAACNFLDTYWSHTPGLPSFKEHMQARAMEEINLQAILLQTTEPTRNILRSLHILAWHQYQARPRTELIQHAAKLASKGTDQKMAGYILDCYAAILFALNHFEESLEQRKLARVAFLGASETAQAARTLLDIADVLTLIDPAVNEIPLIEHAQREIESIGTYVDTASMEIVRCLMRLGQAHSRHGKHSQAIVHLIEARKLCFVSTYQGAHCAYNLARAHHGLQQLTEAEEWAILAMKERKDNGGYVGHILWVLGMIYISKGEYDQAIDHLQEGLESAKTRGDQRYTANILLEFARANMKNGKGDDARTLFMETLVTYGNLQGVSQEKLVCKFYLDKLDDPSRVPTSEEREALQGTWHSEDVPP